MCVFPVKYALCRGVGELFQLSGIYVHLGRQIFMTFNIWPVLVKLEYQFTLIIALAETKMYLKMAYTELKFRGRILYC